MERDGRIPAVVYARYSSSAQNEQSIDGQLRDARAFAEREGYVIIKEYIDRAQSGTSDQRDSFQRMIREAARHQFDVVLVWKLDRFARNRYDSATYKAKLKREGVRVVSVMERIADSTEGIILEGLLESMAEYYSANLAENVKRGQRETRMKGRPICKVPYGFTRTQDGSVIMDPVRGPVIKDVFEKFAAGIRMKDIVAELNARGVQSPAGKTVTVKTFIRYLSNPYYVGKMPDHLSQYPCPFPALVNQDTFDKVQMLIGAHRVAPAAMRETYLLTGKIYCGCCGLSMCGESGTGKSGRTYVYYKCRGAKTLKTCNKKPEPRDQLENYVFEQTMQYILADGQKEKIADDIIAYLEKDPEQDKIREVERQIAQIETKINNLIETLSEVPRALRAQILAKMEALQTQKDAAENDLACLRLSTATHATRESIVEWLSIACEGDPDDPSFRIRLVDLLVNSVYVSDDMIMIFYNIGAVQAPVSLPQDQGIKKGPDDAGQCSNLDENGTPCAYKSEHRRMEYHDGVLCLFLKRSAIFN